ncbi:hypothetical protein CGZ91_09335 [Parenemella sanctibonifatiensis]|uniref:Uncharacterized protein n=2 Tax=Parenemella sanctibonifatiensis TaxID=2016505 RepID=A0A255EHB2_9ACTN|nr:hypothetical protein CGZ91_09335 [Parenemella sanctibonifatiensis]
MPLRHGSGAVFGTLSRRYGGNPHAHERRIGGAIMLLEWRYERDGVRYAAVASAGLERIPFDGAEPIEVVAEVLEDQAAAAAIAVEVVVRRSVEELQAPWQPGRVWINQEPLLRGTKIQALVIDPSAADALVDDNGQRVGTLHTVALLTEDEGKAVALRGVQPLDHARRERRAALADVERGGSLFGEDGQPLDVPAPAAGTGATGPAGAEGPEGPAPEIRDGAETGDDTGPGSDAGLRADEGEPDHIANALAGDSKSAPETATEEAATPAADAARRASVTSPAAAGPDTPGSEPAPKRVAAGPGPEDNPAAGPAPLPQQPQQHEERHAVVPPPPGSPSAPAPRDPFAPAPPTGLPPQPDPSAHAGPSDTVPHTQHGGPDEQPTGPGGQFDGPRAGQPPHQHGAPAGPGQPLQGQHGAPADQPPHGGTRPPAPAAQPPAPQSSAAGPALPAPPGPPPGPGTGQRHDRAYLDHQAVMVTQLVADYPVRWFETNEDGMLVAFTQLERPEQLQDQSTFQVWNLARVAALNPWLEEFLLTAQTGDYASYVEGQGWTVGRLEDLD